MKVESAGTAPANTGFQFRGSASSTGGQGYSNGAAGTVFMDETAEELPLMISNHTTNSSTGERFGFRDHVRK